MSARRHARVTVAARWLAALAGGYGVASLLAIVLARTLPMPPIEASMTAMMIAFLAYAGIIMAVIHTRTVRRAWVGLVCTAIALTITALSTGVWSW